MRQPVQSIVESPLCRDVATAHFHQLQVEVIEVMVEVVLTRPLSLGHRLSSVTPRGRSSVRPSLGPVADTPAHCAGAACCIDAANVQ